MIQQLCNWYQRDESAILARDEFRTYTNGDLKQNVNRWIHFLQQKNGVIFGAHFTSLWQSLSFCLAMWSLQKTPCMLGDYAHYSNQDMIDQFDGLVFENDIESCTHSCDSSSELFFAALDESNEIAFMTSGSSGTPKIVKKMLWQLCQEIELIEEAWSFNSNLIFIGTASHQHLYGFTFRVCWPFLTGHQIFLPLCRYGEDIARYAMSLEAQAFIVISTPSHLTRLNQVADWHRIFQTCVCILSSTAPLAEEQSQQIAQMTGVEIREIYGSTETGIIAWKSQQLESQRHWQLFKSMQVHERTDGQYLQTPLLSYEHKLDDQLQMSGRQFKLMGRLDRIVKLEGKRVNLIEIETLAKSHALVSDAAAVVIQLRHREEIAVVCELKSESNTSTIQDFDLVQLKSQLEHIISTQVAPVVCPRRWRFTLALPRNQQGKRATAEMKSWFLEKREDFPQLKHIHLAEDQCTFQFLVQPKVHYFQGHFDSAPILPGVVQIHWAVYYGRNAFPIRGAFKKLEVIKFQKVIQPGALVTLDVSYKISTHKLVFTYKEGEDVMSSGRICFE